MLLKDKKQPKQEQHEYRVVLYLKVKKVLFKNRTK